MSLIDKSERFSFARPFGEVYDAVKLACNNIKGMTLVSIDRERPIVILDCGVTLWSWGESVTVECLPMGPDRTDLVITSKPKLATTLVDYGKGKRNISKVYEAVTSVLLSKSK